MLFRLDFDVRYVTYKFNEHNTLYIIELIIFTHLKSFLFFIIIFKLLRHNILHENEKDH